jgi:adenylate cyclase
VPLLRAAADHFFDSGSSGIYVTTMVLVETLLDRGADDDLDEAKSAIARLAALAGDASAVVNVGVLRLRALLARALGDEAAYRDYRDRYRAMATALGLEGHMKWAEAMT